ncbi:MAG: response regulator [Methylophilaceae bacterium]|nr:response regulator [Methyloradius sp.]
MQTATHNSIASYQQPYQLEQKPMQVLLIEDSALLREAIMEVLSHASLNFKHVATTQADAIALLDKETFDFMIVDIELAQGNGFEVIKHVMQPDYPFTPPIAMILTNHAHPHYRQRAKDLGVKYFFDKSMDFDSAIDTIEEEAAKFTL